MSAISSCICVISYGLIHRYVTKHMLTPEPSNDTISLPTTQRRKLQRRRDELTITKNLMCVMCGYFLCVSLYISLFMVLPFLGGQALKTGLHVSSYGAVLAVMDSCLNPLIYAFRHPHMRTVFVCMLQSRFQDIPEPSRYLTPFLRRDTFEKSSSGISETVKSQTEIS